MAREIRLHPTAAKFYASMASSDRERVKAALGAVADDPITKRPGADIKRLKGTRGRQDLFRLRIGSFRAVYAVEDKEILVTDLFRRGQGYDV